MKRRVYLHVNWEQTAFNWSQFEENFEFEYTCDMALTHPPKSVKDWIILERFDTDKSVWDFHGGLGYSLWVYRNENNPRRRFTDIVEVACNRCYKKRIWEDGFSDIEIEELSWCAKPVHFPKTPRKVHKEYLRFKEEAYWEARMKSQFIDADEPKKPDLPIFDIQ